MRRRIRRLVTTTAAVLTVTLAASTAVASAADYDSADGFLRTPSGATTVVAMQCGRNGKLVLQTGATAPQLYSFRATNSAGVTTGWMPWRSLSSYTVETIITKPGYWVVQAQVAHHNGRTWTVDSEFAPVSVQPPGYNDRFWCKVTG